MLSSLGAAAVLFADETTPTTFSRALTHLGVLIKSEIVEERISRGVVATKKNRDARAIESFIRYEKLIFSLGE